MDGTIYAPGAQPAATRTFDHGMGVSPVTRPRPVEMMSDHLQVRVVLRLCLIGGFQRMWTRATNRLSQPRHQPTSPPPAHHLPGRQEVQEHGLRAGAPRLSGLGWHPRAHASGGSIRHADADADVGRRPGDAQPAPRQLARGHAPGAAARRKGRERGQSATAAGRWRSDGVRDPASYAPAHFNTNPAH